MPRSVLLALLALLAVACEDARRPGGSGGGGGSPRDASGSSADAARADATQASDAEAREDAPVPDAEGPVDQPDAEPSPDRPASFDARPAPDAFTFDAGFPDALTFPDAARPDARPLPDATSTGDSGAPQFQTTPTLDAPNVTLFSTGTGVDFSFDATLRFSNTGGTENVSITSATATLNGILGGSTMQLMTIDPAGFQVPPGSSAVAIRKVAGSPAFPSTNCILGLALLDISVSFSNGAVALAPILPVTCPP